jgi:hypothetical protein
MQLALATSAQLGGEGQPGKETGDISLMKLNHANHTMNNCKASTGEASANPAKSPLLPEKETKVKPDALFHASFTNVI